MAADGNAVHAGVKAKGLRFRHKGQNHPAEGGVGVDVGLTDRQIRQNIPHRMEVVHRPFHRSADVRQENDRRIPVDADGFVQVIVVNFPIVLAADHNVPHIQHPQVFEDAVVGVLGKIDHALGVKFPPHIEAVHIALGAAGSNIAPSLFRLQAQQLGKSRHHFPLEGVAVAAEVAVVKGIAHIVGAIVQKGQQLRIVEVLVDRIADLRGAQPRQVVQQGIQTLAGRRA